MLEWFKDEATRYFSNNSSKQVRSGERETGEHPGGTGPCQAIWLQVYRDQCEIALQCRRVVFQPG